MPVDAPQDIVRRLFDARATGDVRTAMALLDPSVRSAFAPDPVTGRRIEIDAHRIEAEDGEHVLVHGRIRVFDTGSLSDSPASWRFTVRGGRVVGVTALRSEQRLRRVA